MTAINGKDDPNKPKPINDDSDESSGGQSDVVSFTDFLITKDTINQTMNDMRQALLGVAEVEAGILKNIKEHLDQMLNTVYKQVREYQHLATIDAMVSDQPLTTADPAIIQGLNSISENLSEKNAAILKLQRELEVLGAGAFVNSGMSAEMLRSQLEELTKRNKELKVIHGELLLIVSSSSPSSSLSNTSSKTSVKETKPISVKEMKTMLENINEQIQRLNQTNAHLKAEIKQQKLQAKAQTMDNKPKPDDSTSSTPTFRRK